MSLLSSNSKSSPDNRRVDINNHNNNQEQLLLQAKIERLLQQEHPLPKWKNERSLAALVLWTRLVSDRAHKTLWARHHSHLLEFCFFLLQQNHQDEEAGCQVVYARLIAQLSSRLQVTNEDEDDRTENESIVLQKGYRTEKESIVLQKVIQALAAMLLGVLENRSRTNSAIAIVDLEIVAALDAGWLQLLSSRIIKKIGEQQQQRQVSATAEEAALRAAAYSDAAVVALDRALLLIWERHAANTAAGIRFAEHKNKNAEKEMVVPQVVIDSSSSTTVQSPLETMKKVLTQILNQGTNCAVVLENIDDGGGADTHDPVFLSLRSTWEAEVARVLGNYGAAGSLPKALPLLPRFFQHMLPWWLTTNDNSKKKNPHYNQNNKHPTRHHHPPASLSAVPRTSSSSSSTSTSSSAWARILLLCLLNHYSSNRSQMGDNDNENNKAFCQQKLLQPTEHSISITGNDTTTTTTPSSSSLPRFLAEDILQLLLACIVTTDPNSDDLRSMAWSAVTTLVDACEWEWLLVLPPSNNNNNNTSSGLGRASKLCTLLRLASGELAIQLGFLHATTTSSATTGTSSSSNSTTTLTLSKDRILVIEATAKFLLQVLSLIVQLADDPTMSLERMDMDTDDNEDDDDDDSVNANRSTSLSLSGEALLHIRKSLENALCSSAQYLSMMMSTMAAAVDNDKNQNDSPAAMTPIHNVIIQLLGGLLSEFDVFEKQYYNNTKSRGNDNDDEQAGNNSNSRENEVLSAVRAALETRDVQAQQCFLPGLLALVAAAEGHDARMAALKEYEILGQPLVAFLQAYWEQCCLDTTNPGSSSLSSSSVKCVLTLIEMWYPVLVDTADEQLLLSLDSRLPPRIAEFIQLVLDAPPGTRDENVVAAVSAAVACYVTLQGEQPPDEPDASILRRAIEFCA